jgi:Flp pilus assembly protein TadD
VPRLVTGAVPREGEIWKNPAEAETLYRGVLGRYPSDADARSGLGWSLLKQGKRPEARQAFLTASRAAPRSPTVIDGLNALDR